MLVMFFSSTSMSISLPFNSRTMPKSFFTGTVVRRAFDLGLHLAGDGHVQIRGGEFHAVPSARSSTLERMGSVVRVLTTFWTACRPARFAPW
jgi:PPE-repeat protein